MFRSKVDKNSISGKMYRLVGTMAGPMVVFAVFILGILIIYSAQYSAYSSNIALASGFNQNFKDEVDLKMYAFVTGSDDELPTKEIEEARQLAKRLLDNTTNTDSEKAISNVLHLCDSLNNSITEIESTDGYDLRMEQLEKNIYVITELIQEHMYTYLYYEAGEMGHLQRILSTWIVIETVAVGVMLVIIITSMRKALKISRSITDPIDELYVRVGEIAQGDLTEKDPVDAEDVKLKSLGVGVEDMASKLSEQIELNKQEQIKLRGIELSLIQAQINPHFLYNTLDAIVWLIETDQNQKAEEMITNLSTYFRSFLSNGKDIITVAEEALHVKSYLEIQQVRYRDILSYEIDIDERINNCSIPKMTIQPLVENAIYHGIKPKRGMGKITVTGTVDNGDALLTVSDTGIGLTTDELASLRQQVESESESGFGLMSAKKRLRLMFADKASVRIDSVEGEGTSIMIRIPMQNQEAVNAQV